MKHIKKFNENRESDHCEYCDDKGKEPNCPMCGRVIDYYESDDSKPKSNLKFGSSWMKKKRFFFDQDSSSHWYMVPVDLKEQWNKLNTSDEDDQDTIDEFEKIFAEYRTGGDISSITFENPSK